jgi:gas vesicle protein
MAVKIGVIFALVTTACWLNATVCLEENDKAVHEALLTSVELSKLDKEWRDDIRQASEPYFVGKGEDASQVVEFYAQWLRDWLQQNLVDKPKDSFTDWSKSFKTYYEDSKPKIEEFLKGQYARYHERFDNVAEAMEAMQAKANERLQRFSERLAESSKDENKYKYEALLTSVELAKIDEEWRRELQEASKSWLGEKAEDVSEVVEFYSKWLQDWLHEQTVEKPADSLRDWKTAFKSYYEGTKPYVQEFLSKQYERYNEGVESAKQKVNDAMEAAQTIATDRLEQLANKFPAVSEHTRVEL